MKLRTQPQEYSAHFRTGTGTAATEESAGKFVFFGFTESTEWNVSARFGVPSFPRWRESSAAIWIPACAGMTGGPKFESWNPKCRD